MTRYDAATLANHGLAQKQPEQAEIIKFPDHYRQSGDIEVIDHIESAVAGYKDPTAAFLVGQVLKYLYRAPFKGDALQDLKKAHRYLGRLIAKMEGRNGWE